MDKLKALLARCKCGVILTVNDYRNSYETPEEAIEFYDGLACAPDINDYVMTGILSTGNIIDLIFYPNTPISSYHIVHYDLDAALDKALECLDQQS
jgi:hypothetical protein